MTKAWGGNEGGHEESHRSGLFKSGLKEPSSSSNTFLSSAKPATRLPPKQPMASKFNNSMHTVYNDSGNYQVPRLDDRKYTTFRGDVITCPMYARPRMIPDGSEPYPSKALVC